MKERSRIYPDPGAYCGGVVLFTLEIFDACRSSYLYPLSAPLVKYELNRKNSQYSI